MKTNCHHVSDFDRGRIVAHQDFGLSYREIDRRVNCTAMTMKRVCRVWTEKKEEPGEDQLVHQGVPQRVKIGTSDD